MPVVIPAILLPAVIGSAVSVGANMLISAIVGKPNTDHGKQVDVRQPISYRDTVYGTVRKGGVITYLGTNNHAIGSKPNQFLHMVITLSGHAVHALNQNNLIYIDGTAYTLGVQYGNYRPVLGKYNGRMWIESHTGVASTDQPFPGLAADVADWTSTCLQYGCAKVHIKMQYDTDVYANGIPQFTFDVQGKEVFDPRSSTTVFTSNPALLLRDYLLSSDGMSVDSSMIDDTATIAAANICDEAVVLREGGTQKRYEANGVLTSDKTRGEIVKLLTGAMMGIVVPPGDAWRMFAGSYRTSVMDITDSMLRGPIKMDTRVSKRDLCNGVKGTYTGPSNNWQPSDYPAYKSAAYSAEDGEALWSDVSFELETDPVRAQRRAKILVEQARTKRPLVLPCKLLAFPLDPGDTITFTHSRWGLSAATYMVSQTALSTETTEQGIVLGSDLICYPVASSMYAWDPDVDEGTVIPCTAPLLPDSSAVEPVTGMALLSDASTTITRADGIAHTRIKVTWTAPDDEMVQAGGVIQVWVRPTGGAYRLDGYADGTDSEYYISNSIVDGVSYDVKLVAESVSGAHSSGVEGTVIATSTPSNLGSLVMKPTFEDGEFGLWSGADSVVPVVGQGFSKALKCCNRDALEAHWFPVKKGDKYFLSASVDTTGLSGHPSDGQSWVAAIGLWCQDSAGGDYWYVAAQVNPGAAWGTISGSITLPDNVVKAKPWLQIAAFPSGSTYYALWSNIYARKIIQDGEVALTTSTGLNGQGSLVSVSADSLVYDSTATSIRWHWDSPFYLYLFDGTTVTIPANSTGVAFSGLNPSTTYHFLMWVQLSDSSVHIALSTQGTPVGTAKETLQNRTQTAQRDGRVALRLDGTADTPASGGTGGGSGGGGGTGCFTGAAEIETPDGFVPIGSLPKDRPFDIVNATGTHQAELLVHADYFGWMIQLEPGKLVTIDHLMRCGEVWIAADAKYPTQERVYFTRGVTVYNIHVLSDNPDDQHFRLWNGDTAHNSKLA